MRQILIVTFDNTARIKRSLISLGQLEQSTASVYALLLSDGAFNMHLGPPTSLMSFKRDAFAGGRE